MLLIKVQSFIFIFRAICIVSLITAAKSVTNNKCNRSCHGDLVQYPFGFSSGCEIRLNCSKNGTKLIGEFPVQTVTSSNILVYLPAKCGRSIDHLRTLFTPNYAPTSKNGILLQNCTTSLTACILPTTMVQTHFELLDCGDNDSNNISCYSEPNNSTLFIDFLNVTRSGCRSLFSAISVDSQGNGSAVSLDVQVVQLGWWRQGHCQCSEHAFCTRISSPFDGRPSYRCQCSQGFVGDGFRSGLGCRKESAACKPSKYLSGRCGGTTRIAVLAGGVVSGALLMVSVGLICCFVRRHYNSKARNRISRQLCKTAGISIPIYPYKDIEKATDGFSDQRRQGTGAYGTVYSGKLQNDEWVAIKRIKYRDTDSIEQVINEIKLLSCVDHPNLVRLLGCSIEKGEQILVYEFMPNGTLCQHLQRERGDGLTWPVRLTIAAETAQAISYLHNAMNPPIYHRDIKSSNILLGFNYISKVADFGLSRLGMIESSHISTAPQGTPGYLDPQYHQNFHLSDKSDVYSFGVVLVEIITALKAVDFSRPQDEVNLAALAIDKIGKGCLDEIIDPFLKPKTDAWALSSMHKVAELAFRCLAFHKDMRPSMMEVAIELEQIRLSRWSALEVSTTSAPEDTLASCSSTSKVSDKPLSLSIKRSELDRKGRFFDSVDSIDGTKDYSPVSIQDHWPSEQSSPSSSSLLGHVIQ